MFDLNATTLYFWNCEVLYDLWKYIFELVTKDFEVNMKSEQMSD